LWFGGKGGGGEGIGDHLKWAGGRWGGREGILGNAYYWDLRRGGERADAEIEPWAPNLNHSYWSKLTIEGRDMGGGGGSEQQRLWIGWQCWEEARGEGGAVDPPL
jgi:hypothetical protein